MAQWRVAISTLSRDFVGIHYHGDDGVEVAVTDVGEDRGNEAFYLGGQAEGAMCSTQAVTDRPAI